MTRDPEEIRADIEESREELADAAAALAYKTDVKARAKDRVDEIKSDIREKAPHAPSQVTTTARQNPIPTAAIAAVVVGFAIGYLIANRD